MMTLYSWFSRIKTEPKNKKIRNELSKASQSVQYIENYTMWPTAKIKPDAQVLPPNYNNVDETTVPSQSSIIDITH